MKHLVLLAPSCDPNDVSESLVGFNMASRLAKRFPTTIITMLKEGQSSLRRWVPEASVIECREWPIRRYDERLAAIVKPSYAKFYWWARGQLKSILHDRGIDLVHQITPCSPRYPSPGVFLPPRVKLVLGPYGGGVVIPRGFERELGRGPWYSRLRWVDQARYRFDPILRASLKRADLVLCALPYVRDYTLRHAPPLRRTEVVLETAVEALPPERHSAVGESGARLLFVGRLTRAKGAMYAVRAMSHLADIPGIRLDVVGGGEMEKLCRSEVRRLGLEGRVVMHGSMSRTEVMRFYGEADVFVFPSLREPTGNVVLEAMSFGVPLVVADHGGPGEIVTDECGLRVAPGDPHTLPRRVAKAIRRLLDDPELRRKLGAGARATVQREYLWEAKIDRICDLYEELLSGSGAGAAPSEATDTQLTPALA